MSAGERSEPADSEMAVSFNVPYTAGDTVQKDREDGSALANASPGVVDGVRVDVRGTPNSVASRR
jgi:hypothetical protein